MNDIGKCQLSSPLPQPEDSSRATGPGRFLTAAVVVGSSAYGSMLISILRASLVPAGVRAASDRRCRRPSRPRLPVSAPEPPPTAGVGVRAAPDCRCRRPSRLRLPASEPPPTAGAGARAACDCRCRRPSRLRLPVPAPVAGCQVGSPGA